MSRKTTKKSGALRLRMGKYTIYFIKLKSSKATYPTSNAKSLACDTANEHALTCTRETCSCSQTAVQWNQWR